MKLTPNFSLDEFIKPGTLPRPEHLENIKCLANRLQVLRDLLGKPIKVNSGYRTPEQNAAVGGAPSSQHLLGKACDIQLSNKDQAKLKLWETWSGGMGKGDNWCHLDIRDHTARWTY